MEVKVPEGSSAAEEDNTESRSVTSARGRAIFATHRWTIKNFQSFSGHIGLGSFLSSTTFPVANGKWSLRFYINGGECCFLLLLLLVFSVCVFLFLFFFVSVFVVLFFLSYGLVVFLRSERRTEHDIMGVYLQLDEKPEEFKDDEWSVLYKFACLNQNDDTKAVYKPGPDKYKFLLNTFVQTPANDSESNVRFLFVCLFLMLVVVLIVGLFTLQVWGTEGLIRRSDVTSSKAEFSGYLLKDTLVLEAQWKYVERYSVCFQYNPNLRSFFFLTLVMIFLC